MNNGILISDWLSPDERYCIFLDELYDIKNKKKIGHIWENFDHFKFFLRYSTSVSDLNETIKESIFLDLNKDLLTESLTTSSTDDIKKIINESIWGDFVGWAKEQGKSSVEGFKEFIKTSKEGMSDFIDSIPNSDLWDALQMVGKGIYYLMKKLRDALYHPVGMVLDAILVATGIGKAVQWVPWAIVVVLDVIEIATGDYEGPLWMQLLMAFGDVLALLTTGAIAKGYKITLKGLKKVEDVASNPQIKKYLQKAPDYLEKISPKLKDAAKYLADKFPAGANIIKQSLSKVDSFINKMMELLKKLFSAKSVISGTVSAGAIYGMEKLMHAIAGVGIDEEELMTVLNNPNFNADMSNIDFTNPFPDD